MPEPILHLLTKQKLDSFIKSPSHGLALIGRAGIGKRTVADWLVHQLLDLNDQNASRQANILVVNPEQGSISIETSRQISRFLELKSIGKNQLRRAVIIEHADQLTLEAQNALLKTLEEPPLDSIIILTVNHPHHLQPTVLSRLVQINILRPSEQNLRDNYVPKLASAQKYSQAYNLSGGLPGLLKALLSDADHPLQQSVNEAKLVLSAKTFERLVLADKIAKQKGEALTMIEALLRIAESALQTTAKNNRSSDLIKWQNILMATSRAADALEKNVQPKLVLSNLMLAL